MSADAGGLSSLLSQEALRLAQGLAIALLALGLAVWHRAARPPADETRTDEALARARAIGGTTFAVALAVAIAATMGRCAG